MATPLSGPSQAQSMVSMNASLMPPTQPIRSSSARTDKSHVSTTKYEMQLTDQTNLLPHKTVIMVFFGLSLCVLVSALDSTIVATTIPTISSAFNAGSVVSWVPSAYLLTSTSFQPLYGRFSDIFGRKSALALSMTIFMVGNLIAGFSKSIVEMIVARGIAGAGGGGIVSLMQIIISDIVSLRERKVMFLFSLFSFSDIFPEESIRASSGWSLRSDTRLAR
jgi:hypothetical protein